MMAGWAAYKTALIVADGTDGSMRVQRPSDGNDTVSEGISYGMLFAVYMNDKATFDAIWKYEQKHLNTHGLMNWHISSGGTTAGANSATDADEDMAFALVMADKQWGGYATTATTMLTTVAMYDFGTDGTIKGGDFYVAVNPSYIAPAFYRVFAAYVTDATQRTRWMTILDKSYEILGMVQNTTSGLVPDWSAGPATNTSYGYDATRTPFRIALDYCWSGDARAKTFSMRIGTFFARHRCREHRRRLQRQRHEDRQQQELDLHRSGGRGRDGVGPGSAGRRRLHARRRRREGDRHQLLRSVVGAVHGHVDDG